MLFLMWSCFSDFPFLISGFCILFKEALLYLEVTTLSSFLPPSSESFEASCFLCRRLSLILVSGFKVGVSFIVSLNRYSLVPAPCRKGHSYSHCPIVTGPLCHKSNVYICNSLLLGFLSVLLDFMLMSLLQLPD